MVIKSLEVTVVSAKDLHNVNVIHKMDPYVIVSLSNNHKQSTQVHKKGGTSPRWVKLVTFPVDEASAGLLFLVFEIMTKKTLCLGGHKEVGKVEVGIDELLKNQGDGKPKSMSCNVELPSGKTQGVLEFKYKFGEELPAGSGKTHQEPPKKSGGQGLISGVTNGLASGVTEGLTEGLTTGLTSGLTEGLTNALK